MKKETSLQQPTSTNVENSQDKENYSPEIHHVIDTPFTIVKIDDLYTITVGNIIVSERRWNGLEDAKEYINGKPYELLFNGISVYVDKINELKKLQENEQNNSDNN